MGLSWQESIVRRCGEESFFDHDGRETPCGQLCKENMRPWEEANCENHCRETFNCLANMQVTSSTETTVALTTAVGQLAEENQGLHTSSTVLIGSLIGTLCILMVILCVALYLISLRKSRRRSSQDATNEGELEKVLVVNPTELPDDVPVVREDGTPPNEERRESHAHECTEGAGDTDGQQVDSATEEGGHDASGAQAASGAGQPADDSGENDTAFSPSKLTQQEQLLTNKFAKMSS